MQSISNVGQRVHATHQPWEEMAKVIEKEKPDLLVLEYPCQFET